jgi:molecular chaperone GrpE
MTNRDGTPLSGSTRSEAGTGRSTNGGSSKGLPAERFPGAAEAPEGAGLTPTAEEVAEAPGADASEDAEVAEGGRVEGFDAVARERDEYLDALRRLQADFENYKKRILKQQTAHLERAAEALVDKLLPVLDTLDLALAHTEKSEDPEGQALVQVRSMLSDVLAREGLERIEPLDEPFDPTAHDAVMHEEGDKTDPAVTEVFRAGYRWKGRVIRPAMVKVTG